MPNIDRLVTVWQNWDHAPSAEFRANQLEDEVQLIATDIGTTGSALRNKVIEGRHADLSLREAIDAAVNGNER